MSYNPLCSFKTMKENYTDKNKGNYVNQIHDPLHRKKTIIILMYASFVIILKILYFFRLWL